eukprot:EG_transcript_25302
MVSHGLQPPRAVALPLVVAVAAAALGAAALALALSPAAAPPLSLAARPAAVTRRTALRGARPEWGPAGLDRPSPLAPANHRVAYPADEILVDTRDSPLAAAMALPVVLLGAVVSGLLWAWRRSPNPDPEFASAAFVGFHHDLPSAHSPRRSTALGLFGWGKDNNNKEEDEEYIPGFRRSGETMEDVKARRKIVSQYMRKTLPPEQMAKIKKANEAKARALSKEGVTGGIPIPLPSFGIPEFDGGERFDLRGKYVD